MSVCMSLSICLSVRVSGSPSVSAVSAGGCLMCMSVSIRLCVRCVGRGMCLRVCMSLSICLCVRCVGRGMFDLSACLRVCVYVCIHMSGGPHVSTASGGGCFICSVGVADQYRPHTPSAGAGVEVSVDPAHVL